VDERLWLGTACVVGLMWLVGMVASWRLPRSTPDTPAPPAKGERVLRPRTPDDCGLCRVAAGPAAGDEAAAQCERVVCPWAEVKSRRGRRKQAKTEGYACPNEECEVLRDHGSVLFGNFVTREWRSYRTIHLNGMLTCTCAGAQRRCKCRSFLSMTCSSSSLESSKHPQLRYLEGPVIIKRVDSRLAGETLKV
jgi:hypothetical protein